MEKKTIKLINALADFIIKGNEIGHLVDEKNEFVRQMKMEEASDKRKEERIAVKQISKIYKEICKLRGVK